MLKRVRRHIANLIWSSHEKVCDVKYVTFRFWTTINNALKWKLSFSFSFKGLSAPFGHVQLNNFCHRWFGILPPATVWRDSNWNSRSSTRTTTLAKQLTGFNSGRDNTQHDFSSDLQPTRLYRVLFQKFMPRYFLKCSFI